MTRSGIFRVEVLETRATPSGAAFSGGVFLPPGLVGGVDYPNIAPPPVQVGTEGTPAFLPPGLIRGIIAIDDPNFAPPVQVGRDGAISFLPPGASQGAPGS